MRTGTEESYQERILRVLAHIEGRLDDPLPLDELAGRLMTTTTSPSAHVVREELCRQIREAFGRRSRFHSGYMSDARADGVVASIR